MRPEVIRFPHKLPVQASLLSIENLPYHWHDCMEILQVLEGTVFLWAGDDKLELHPMDIAAVNPDELHRVTTDNPDNRVLSIHVDPDFHKRTIPGGYSFLYCCSTYHEHVRPQQYQTLKRHLAALVVELVAGNDDGGHLSTVDGLLRGMLLYLEREFDFLRWGFGTTPFDDRRVQRLRQIARQTTSNKDVDLRLKALAAEAGVTLQYLSNDIKDKFGRTFKDLLYYGKCELAARMLLGTGKRIVDVSLECGFSDPKYLIKHFKRLFGCTPSEFRIRHARDPQSLIEETRFRVLPLSDANRYFTPAT